MGLFDKFKKLFIKTSDQDNSKSIPPLPPSPPSQKSIEVPLKYTIEITRSNTSSDGSRWNDFVLKPIQKDVNGNWILNPGTSFNLTLIGATKEVANQIRSILDEGYVNTEKRDLIISLFAKHNLQIQEIEAYKNKYKPIYQAKLQSLINASSEWESSGPKDREDLLTEFKEMSVNLLYEIPHCDVEALLEFDNSNVTLDDDLLNDYDFKAFSTYLYNASKMDKIHVIKKEDSERSKFENLVSLGLAFRGNEIAIQEILLTLTMKELNAIASNPEKVYTRKNQAVEYILTLHNLPEIISQHISLREVFKLKPLPEKYSSIDINAISETWAYHRIEFELLMTTFSSALSMLRMTSNNEYVSNHVIENYSDPITCHCAIETMKKIFPGNQPPSVPFHIGCNCYSRPNYN